MRIHRGGAGSSKHVGTRVWLDGAMLRGSLAPASADALPPGDGGAQR